MKTGDRKKQARASFQTPSVLGWSGVLRPQSCLLYMALLSVLVTGLSVVRTTHSNRFAFNELQELREEANQFEVMWGQLLLEQSTFGVEGRIEQKAQAELNMQLPEISSVVMVKNE